MGILWSHCMHSSPFKLVPNVHVQLPEYNFGVSNVINVINIPRVHSCPLLAVLRGCPDWRACASSDSEIREGAT